MEIASAVASLTESYPATAESIPRARIALSAFAAEAGASCEQQEQVRLVVSEAVTNAVQHAYRERPGDVHVTAMVVSGELWILVADDGVGLCAGSDSAGLGLGLAWMAQFSDGMTLVARSDGGVEVRLRFDLRGADAFGARDSRSRIAGVC
ncbi:MAG: putative anti-sigma regulatory factor, serine/threonine protein kinase [Solirubrobacterales bacterium]|jgi:anti-sigma regulatory factor (Ser/Thr protein kinase)|nr:putative anti-sigma regulatory factor, serine/threonine protein kinase [Solirubrobacterales bacterium]MCW3024896.1 putative anti-sigma regulatory factor, serine/threonine protein kinase [Solirubrobacterales bacterium]